MSKQTDRDREFNDLIDDMVRNIMSKTNYEQRLAWLSKSKELNDEREANLINSKETSK